MYLFVGSPDFFHRPQRSSIKSGSISSSTILLPMQEKAIINALIKSSSDGYHLGLTSLHYSWIAQVPW